MKMTLLIIFVAIFSVALVHLAFLHVASEETVPKNPIIMKLLKNHLLLLPILADMIKLNKNYINVLTFFLIIQNILVSMFVYLEVSYSKDLLETAKHYWQRGL